ncbi:MAG: branched-chain amino acid transaminase [Candidatus Moranbacteria bacterium]|nr:branched-chain amino acid transaminase [Candidatus Moranbacteria bacterium]
MKKLDPPYPYAYFEGKVTKLEKAKIPITVKAFQYGQAIFAGIKGYYEPVSQTVNVFRLQDHYNRMLDAVKIIPFKWNMSYAEFKKIITNLTKKNQVKTNCYYRPNVYSADPTIVPTFTRANDQMSIYMQPLGEYLDTSKGIKVMVSSWLRTPDNSISVKAKVTGLYVNSSLAKYEATNNGYDDAILMNPDGSVCEGSGANIFMVKNKVLYTPPLEANNLAGITRRSILHLAQNELGFETQERKFDRSQLYASDELFFTGTAAQVSWIKSVDQRLIGNGKLGPMTRKIKDLFFNIVQGRDQKYASWLTPIRVSK